jgi:arylsulfatase
MAYRDDRFKFIFARQDAKGMEVWRNPLTNLRAPLVLDLKSDPYEYAWDSAATYEDWMMKHAFLTLPAVAKVSEFLATFKQFPPRQRPASFSIDQVIEKLQSTTKGK